MANKELSYVIGIIKSREKYLVGEEKLARLLEADSLSDALKTLKEMGYGGEENFDEDYESLLAAEEEKAIAFLRENYNGEAAAYLAAGVDFHNAECAVRAAFSGGNAPYKRGGSVTGEALYEAAKSATYAQIPTYLATPMQAAATLFKEGNASGVSVGMIFLSAYYAHLTSVAKSKWLKNALCYEIDAKNIATVLRSRDMALAEPMLLSGGKISKKQLAVLLSDRAEEQADKLGEYKELALMGIEGMKTRSLVAFERAADSFSMKKLKERRYETEGTFPLLLYAFYKKAELANVRIVLVGKRGGVPNEQIKARLKEGYAG